MRIKLFLYYIMLLCATVTFAGDFSLVPLPSSVQMAEGEFVFGKKLNVAVADYPGDSLQAVVDRFAPGFSKSTGVVLKKSKIEKAQMSVSVNSKLPYEGYRLKVEKKGIAVEVSSPAGLFYALQTLRQIVESPVASDGAIPALSILDWPDLQYRGVVEGFYGTPWSHQTRLSLIDTYGRYKMNYYI